VGHDPSSFLPPQWRQKCEEAGREPDLAILAQKVREAEQAIFERLQQLDGQPTLERTEIEEGIKQLRQIQVTRLNFPRWEQEN
jgi:hypothetical protein